MVPLNGLEPLLPCGNRILNPTCLPIPPQRQIKLQNNDKALMAEAQKF